MKCFGSRALNKVDFLTNQIMQITWMNFTYCWSEPVFSINSMPIFHFFMDAGAG